MPAYVIVEVTVHNPELYEQYKALTPATVAAHQGEFVVRGGATQSLEGNWHPQRIVILKFPTVALANEWWHSTAYSEAKAIRQQAAFTKMLVVEGV
ncbi:MAG: DUF1330 domain-containing protein [Chitinophagaceae bacterium]